MAPRLDPHSAGNPDQVRVQHISLDLEVDFERKVLRGMALTPVPAAAGF